MCVFFRELIHRLSCCVVGACYTFIDRYGSFFNRQRVLMKKITVLFFGLVFAISGLTHSVAHAAGSATLTLSPSNTSVATGESFALSVLVDPSGAELDTARLELTFDASLLEVTAFDLGSMFPSESPSNEIDNTAGTLSQGAFKFGDAVTSSGVFGTVTFRALSAGDATISVGDESRLIADGDEMIDVASLGYSVISISGADVASETTETTEETTESSSSSGSTTDSSLEAQALVYFGALTGGLPDSADDWEALHCIAYGGCQADPQNVTREGEALALFSEKYGALPSTGMEWNTIHAIAYTHVFIDWGDDEEEAVVEEEVSEEEENQYVDESLSLEAQALVYFGAFYARMPSNGDDWQALHCIAYGGCQGDPRDLVAEEQALVLFGQKYAKMPSTGMEWNVLHTIAYTDLLTYDQQESSSETEELSAEQEAIGWFGALTGALPESDADWTAVDYMIHGYVPGIQNIDAEAMAVDLFVQTFGALPSSESDWNIVSAIAYSGAF